MLSRFTDILLKVSIEGGTRVSMTIGLCFLIVMTKLNDDIIARLYLLEKYGQVYGYE